MKNMIGSLFFTLLALRISQTLTVTIVITSHDQKSKVRADLSVGKKLRINHPFI